jgi:hypothetical protein
LYKDRFFKKTMRPTVPDGLPLQPVCLAYQPPASSTFLSEQTSQQQPDNNTFLSQQISTSHQPLAKRTAKD